MSGVISPRDDIVSGRNTDDEEVDINVSSDRELNVLSRSQQLDDISEQLNIIIELLESIN